MVIFQPWPTNSAKRPYDDLEDEFPTQEAVWYYEALADNAAIKSFELRQRAIKLESKAGID